MLSKNFSLDEMTRSSTAKSKRIDNTPNEAQIEFMVELCQSVLQPIRDKFGPVKINSGFRSAKLNTAIGGSTSSQHCCLNGAAADIYFKLGRAEVFNWIKENLRFDQLIWEFGDENESLDGNGPAWIHVSYNYGKNRNQILKAIKQNGKTKYLNF
jgi:hypothetical protein